MFSRFPKNVGAGLVPARLPLIKSRGRDKPCPYIVLLIFVSLFISCAGKAEQQQTQQAQATPLAAPQPREHLRVCADPNNLPFSNERGEGFENKIAALVAREMNVDVQYTWWAQRRGFVRNTLKA